MCSYSYLQSWPSPLSSPASQTPGHSGQTWVAQDHVQAGEALEFENPGTWMISLTEMARLTDGDGTAVVPPLVWQRSAPETAEDARP